MKAKILFSSLMTLLFAGSYAQDRTTVNATSSEISDNLDLRAVASIFGDSKDLEDFEYRLNDPKAQISNLDLNNDNQVDYLRVIESVEGRTHIIVIQSVLGRDQFQDVATIEVEKDRDNRIQVQVVGDVYMYGSNYIYEPIYVHVPVIYDYFWVSNYRPYYSSWYWGYYPSYYYYWNPCALFRYRHHIDLCINFNHHYNYVNYRRCETAYNHYYGNGRRGNYYEAQYPNRSFSHRNSGYSNRYELDQTRPRRDVAYNDTRNNPRGTRNTSDAVGTPRNTSDNNPRNNSVGTPRGNSNTNPRTADSPRNDTYDTNPRNNSVGTPRGNSNSNPRTIESPRNDTYDTNPRNNSVGSPRVNSNSSPRTIESPRTSTYDTNPRNNSIGSPRGNSNSSPRTIEAPRSTPRSAEPRAINMPSSSPRGGESGGRSGRR